MDSSSLKKMLEKDGWYLVRIKGSHHHFKHPGKEGIVTLPHPKKDVPKGNGKFNFKTGGVEINPTFS